MAEAYLGEIRIFAGTFAPVNWAFCDGQIIAINSNNALYSLLGTHYGGDGRSTFGLPDLRGRVPMHYGTGPGLTSRSLGARGGVEAVALTGDQIPVHTHTMVASEDAANDTSPVGRVLANTGTMKLYSSDTSALRDMSPEAVAYTGAGDSHYNLMPFTALNYIICTQGTYPSRN